MPPARSPAQRIGLGAGAVLFFVMLQLDLDPAAPAVTAMAAVALLMAVWWLTEAIPLFATALLPLVLFPLLGILSTKATAPLYVNSTIFLFLGGFMIALTMEKWNLHKRIALAIIRAIGGGPSRIVLGFMIAAALLSMWISNTATAVMMIPIGLAIIVQMEDRFGRKEAHRFAVGLMIGIAYACSIGGLATLVGTPPNLAFVRIFAITFPEAPEIEFGKWMIMALPVSAVLLVIAWVLITRLFYKVPEKIRVDRSIVEEESAALGPPRFEEKCVGIVFALTALLWVFRNDLTLGALIVPGWSRLISHAELIDDGTVVLATSLSLLFIPTRSAGAKSATVMGSGVVARLPWHIVLLFGGGFALAKGFQETGLSALIGGGFERLAAVPPFAMIVLVCFGLTFLTELTSNTATTQMILPILASVAVATRIHPLLLMIPVTLSASCAFMMPVATPPNAIVFGSGRIRIAEMARVGLVLNLVGVVVVAALFYFLGTALFGIDPASVPAWARGG